MKTSDKGKYINDKECTACAKGYYSDSNTATSCITCPPKTYQDKEGQSSCISCDPNCEECNPETGDCLKCKEAYYANGKNCFHSNAPRTHAANETAGL